MGTIIDERTVRTPRGAQLKFVEGPSGGSSSAFFIFHFPFFIVIEENQSMARIKWQMKNGKWKMRPACYLRFKSVLRRATHIAARSWDQLWLRGERV